MLVVFSYCYVKQSNKEKVGKKSIAVKKTAQKEQPTLITLIAINFSNEIFNPCICEPFSKEKCLLLDALISFSHYKFSSANEAKRLRTTPFKLIVELPGKSLKRSTI